jgi:hypothetical protein
MHDFGMGTAHLHPSNFPPRVRPRDRKVLFAVRFVDGSSEYIPVEPQDRGFRAGTSAALRWRTASCEPARSCPSAAFADPIGHTARRLGNLPRSRWNVTAVVPGPLCRETPAAYWLRRDHSWAGRAKLPRYATQALLPLSGPWGLSERSLAVPHRREPLAEASPQPFRPPRRQARASPPGRPLRSRCWGR